MADKKGEASVPQKVKSRSSKLEEARSSKLKYHYQRFGGPGFAAELGYLENLPDVQVLFDKLNENLFEGQIRIDYCKYSKKLTSNVGYAGPDKKNRPCIRLSYPILRVRSLCDILEAVLHECCHVYPPAVDEDDEHGKKFMACSRRISKETGIRIPEDADYVCDDRKKNISFWRCSGVCRLMAPFYGMLRGRNMPVSTQVHSNVCDGEFIKYRHPEIQQEVALNAPEGSLSETRQGEQEEKSEGLKVIKCFLCDEEGIIKADIYKHMENCLRNIPFAKENNFVEADVDEDVEVSDSGRTIITRNYVGEEYACPQCSATFDEEDLLAHLEENTESEIN